MKLAIVSLMSGQPWGGSEALWYSLAGYALEQGDRVLVSLYRWDEEHPKVKTLKEKGAVIAYRKRFNANAGLGEKLVRSLKKRKPSLNKDYSDIIEFKPDHVFISQGDNFDLAVHHTGLYRLLRENKISYSFVCHGHSQYGMIPSPEIYPAGKAVFENAENVFFVSKRQWSLTERRLLIHLKNASVTSNPLNMQMPSAPLPMPGTEILQMAIVGGLVSGKGHDTAIEILGSEKWKSRQWKLNIYGTGEGEKYLRDAADFFGIKDKVFFHGHTNDILSLWKENHLLLMPSSGEGLPISLAEAMAAGRPAVVTDVGGNTELIEENITGFIAASPAGEMIDRALEKAWQAKDQLEETGRNSFKKIREIFDPAPAKTIYKKLK